MRKKKQKNRDTAIDRRFPKRTGVDKFNMVPGHTRLTVSGFSSSAFPLLQRLPKVMRYF